jgi:hypothetical protein
MFGMAEHIASYPRTADYVKFRATSLSRKVIEMYLVRVMRIGSTRRTLRMIKIDP